MESRILKPVLTRAWTLARKKLGLEHLLSELEPELAERQLHFRAPPLDRELLEAIRQISPQFLLRPSERSRRFWELNQNASCWGEYRALAPFLDRLGTPRRVLDIGPGLGRSTVFFQKVRGWSAVPFDLWESTGRSTRYTQAGPRFSDSFCGDLAALEALLEFNRIERYRIFDAAELDGDLSRLPGPYDFVYSFFAIGFHWSIEHFLDDILALTGPRAIAAFTLHDRFSDLGVLGQLPHRVLEFRWAWPRGRWGRLLVLAKDPAALAV